MAVAALTDDVEWVRARAKEVLESKERFVEYLRSRGRAPLPSSSNFVLLPVADAVSLATATRERGVAVRPFAKLALVGDALRISVGPWSVMERAIETFDEVLGCA
jgi:histidinol-phosphate aminotransferase